MPGLPLTVKCPARCQYYVTAADLRCLEHVLSLSARRANAGPGHLSDWCRIETDGRSQSRLSSRDVRLVLFTVTGWVACTDGLDGDLARLQQWPRREDGPVSRTRGGLRRSAGAANCPGSVPWRPPPWAFALRRAAAGTCGGFPAGATRPLFCCMRQLFRRVACAATRRQARGALGAPLKKDREESCNSSPGRSRPGRCPGTPMARRFDG
jgi:hypothetical protein